MRKTLAVLFSLYISAWANFAFAVAASNHIPDEMYITERWISLTTSYDIDTQTQRLGTLYRRLLSFLLTYDFYDPFDNKLATARAKFFSFNAHFDVYDSQDNYLGAADERLFAFFPTFDVYARDSYSRLATASMNFWGTTFYIYDPLTNQQMAYMTRSFFRIKNNWTFQVTNRELFDARAIDPRVLMTVIAFQGDREYWEGQNQNNSNLRAGIARHGISIQKAKTLLTKIALQRRHEGLALRQPSETMAAKVATELEQGYQQAYPNYAHMRTQEQISTFVDYCLEQVQTGNLTAAKKEVALTLLQKRLQQALN